MRGHLTDTEMTEALGDAAQTEVLDHLACCPGCRADRDRLRATLTALAEQMHVRAARPEAAWDRQARQFMARVREHPARTPRWRWAWAPALVGMAALAGVWFYDQRVGVAPPLENDEALLAAVERSIQTDVPPALRPLALLVGEMKNADASGGLEVGHGG